MAINNSEGIHVIDPKTADEREAVADKACTQLHLDFPAVADGMDNKVGVEYAGWPDRIYVIQTDGKIGFKTGPGPWGFDADALAQYLTDTAGPPAAATPPNPSEESNARVLPNPGESAPDLSGATLAGRAASLRSLRGKVVLIDFWATWCPPCRAALPGLTKLYQKLHSRGFEILGVSLDGASTGTDVGAVKSFAASHGIAWPLFCDGQGWDSPLATAYGVTSLPTTVLIDRDGKVIATGLDGAQLQAAIVKALRP